MVWTTRLREVLTNNWIPKYLCLLLAITVWGVVYVSTTSRESGWESEAREAAPENTQVRSHASSWTNSASQEATRK